MRSAIAILCLAAVFLAVLMGGGVVAAIVLCVSLLVVATVVARDTLIIPRPQLVTLRKSRHLPRGNLPPGA